MAETATIHQFTIDLADADRHVYERLELRVAQHPSETAAYMLVRVLAYCLEYQEGIAFTEGLSTGEEPAVIVRDLTGRATVWVDVGLPDADRLHRAGKRCARVAVYTHRDVRQLLGQLRGERIHRADALVIRSFERAEIDALASRLERRTSMALTVQDLELLVAIGTETLVLTCREHRLGS